MRTPQELQLISRGFANRHRIRILALLSQKPDMSVSELSEALRISFRTASEHTRRLANAGLIKKSYNIQQVEHTLTPLGRQVVKFLRDL